MSEWLVPLAQPLTWFWLGCWGLAVWHLRHRQWRRAIFPAIAGILVSVGGNVRLMARLLATLEQPYTGLDWNRLPNADAVVMLGGVLVPSANDPLGFQLDGPVDRVVAAVELARRGKAGAIVLGGGGHLTDSGEFVEGELVREWLLKWGLDRVPIHVLGACRNTLDEAQKTQVLCQAQKWHQVLLVTSASHLRRAEATFNHVGVPVTPVGCDFAGLSHLSERTRFKPWPDSNGFLFLKLYIHEQIGWWIYRFKGWL